MAENYVYAPSVNALKLLLSSVEKKGVPNKVSDAYLKQNGLPTDQRGTPSTNAKRARSVLRHMELIDDDYVPTSLWKSVRSEREKALLSGLKNLYPDDNSALSSYEEASDKDLFNFFKGGSGLGDATVRMCVSNFKAIRSAAMNGVDDVNPNTPKRDANASGNQTKAKTNAKKPPPINPQNPPPEIPMAPEVVVNIQLQVPADPTGEVYDKFFQSMKKYLYPNG